MPVKAISDVSTLAFFVLLFEVNRVIRSTMSILS